MGTEFDCFNDTTYSDYFETDESNETIKNNRRLLYNIMTSVGFTNLPTEFWHYDYGTRNWAYYTKNKALYRGVFTEEEIKKCNQ